MCSGFGAQPELLLLGARLAKLERRCTLLLPLMLLLDVDDRGEARKSEKRDGKWDGNTLTDEVLHQPMRCHVNDAQSGHAGSGCGLDGPGEMKA